MSCSGSAHKRAALYKGVDILMATFVKQTFDPCFAFPDIAPTFC